VMVRALIAQHPDWHRTALSRHLCELWKWRNQAGRIKDMAARTLTGAIRFQGNTQKDGAADHKVFSRSPRQSQELFHPIGWRLLTGLHCYGPQCTQAYEPLPKWRRGARRPSCLDLVTLLRRQLAENPQTFATGSAPPNYQTMVGAAAPRFSRPECPNSRSRSRRGRLSVMI
jgi:hypothetical protein